MGWIHKLLCLCEHDWQHEKEADLNDDFGVRIGYLYIRRCSKCKIVDCQEVKGTR